MSTVAEDILERFDRLPERDKQEVAAEILRRTRDLESPSFIGSPRLVNQDQISDFAKEVVEESPNGSVRR